MNTRIFLGLTNIALGVIDIILYNPLPDSIALIAGICCIATGISIITKE